jgi:hypothetical protein
VELGDRRWYVAAWATERAVAEHGEFHPLGPWFMLQALAEEEHVDPSDGGEWLLCQAEVTGA